MNLNEAKILVELLLPTIKQITQAAMDRVSEAVGDALAESNRKTNAQLAEIVARIERLENRE
jgi:polyhydroxyalkanoate synthesis regulator phasin